MAEFNSTAFSAVDSFFVIDKKGVDDEPPKTTSGLSAGGKKRRTGVGASKPPAGETTGGNKAATRLMQVGRKKRGRDNDDDDDNEEPEVANDDEDEDELGRTGIASSEPISAEEQVDTGLKKKKKKKKGKKERQLQQQKEEEEKLEATKDETNTEQDTSNPISADGDNVKSEEDKQAKPKNDKPNNQKRKRRKIRSRQKNIYKDNRPINQKPDHLLPGGYEYKGRPMTTATKAKVIAKHGKEAMPSSSSQGDDGFREVWDAGGADSGVPVLSSEATTTTQLMKMNGTTDSKTLEHQARNTTKKNIGTKKKKKNKYKNL